jgi:nitrate reductase gamma subunit
MEHQDPSTLLAIAETIHWIALAVMVIVYTARLIWLHRFRNARERQPPGRPDKTNATKGGVYSLGNVLMPWAMESTRERLPFYGTFVLFHLGVAAGITLAFVSSLYRPLVERAAVGLTIFTFLSAAFLIGLYRIVRRFTLPHLRLISSPDDYFSVIMLTLWFASGMAAQAYFLGGLRSELLLVVFLLSTSFFLVYVPFSKISHYLYYPFTRYWLGRSLGHRGAMPYVRG